MGSRTVWACVLVIAPAAMPAGTSAAGRREQYRLTTVGSAYERGFQQGQQFRDVIRKDFATGDGAKVRELAQSPRSLRRFLGALKTLPHGQELIDEMQGIAEVDEDQWYWTRQPAAPAVWRSSC